MTGQCLSYKPVGGWAGPGRAREESQLVYSRQPTGTVNVNTGSLMMIRAQRVNINPRPWANQQDDHLQLQWPSELSSAPAPAPSFSASSLLHGASEPEVIREVSARCIFQINLRVDNLYYIKLGHISISVMLGNDIFASIKMNFSLICEAKYISQFCGSLCASETNKKR